MHELLERADSRELTEWGLLFGIKHQEADLRREGLTPEEIGDVIAHGGDRREARADRVRLMDTILGEEGRAERHGQMFEPEDEDDDEDEP